MEQIRRFVLTLECRNRIGIVHAVSRFLAERGCNIVDSQQFDDKREHRFTLRMEAELPENGDLEVVREEFRPIAEEFGMEWHLGASDERMRTLVMVSTADHCLNELLDHWQSGLLNIDVVGIVSNHRTLVTTAERFGVPFHHIPVTPETKPHAEAELCDLIDVTNTELVVLARYMQVLSDDLCARLAGRVINIHHSFLPGFKGARPYHQAFDRGVKLIGATAHYVTADLDEGPIIEQSVLRVDHRADPARLAVVGRRAERVALTQAVMWHSERRVFVDGRRTIVFP